MDHNCQLEEENIVNIGLYYIEGAGVGERFVSKLESYFKAQLPTSEKSALLTSTSKRYPTKSGYSVQIKVYSKGQDEKGDASA